MPNYKLTIEYDGKPYHGWQRTADLPTVQEALESAIAKTGHATPALAVAGRTDAGVHARGQVASVKLDKEWECYQLMRAINFYLEDQKICVLDVERVPDDFSARFSAIERSYKYRILNRRAQPVIDRDYVWYVPFDLDVEAMQKAANILIGTHDFSSFRAAGCQGKSPVKTMDSIKLSRHGEEVHVDITAKSFLYNQVRITVGTLVMLGRDTPQPERMREILRSCDRTQAGATAPAHGLIFMGARY